MHYHPYVLVYALRGVLRVYKSLTWKEFIHLQESWGSFLTDHGHVTYIYVSVNYASIASDDDPSPIWHKAILWNKGS